MPPEHHQHPISPDAETSAIGESDDLDVTLARRAPSRWRLARGALIVLALLAMVALAVRGLLALPGRQSLPPVADVMVATLIDSNVSYGTVTVNGVRLSETLPVMATLVAGSNFIKLDAPPFLPVGCQMIGSPGTLTVDPTSVGRCSVTFDHVNGRVVHTVVNVLMTGIDLPPEALASAERVVTDNLARVALGAATVPAGQYYATGTTGAGSISSRRATQPLRAEPSIILAPDSDDVFPSDALLPSDVISGGDARTTLDRCADFGCTLPVDIGYTVPPHGWVIVAALALDWRFITAAGAVVGEARFGLGTMAVPFVVSADGARWTLAADVQSPSGPFASSLDQCQVGAAVVTQLLNQALGLGQVNVSEDVLSQHATGPEGCIVEAEAPAFAIDSARYVWRFGVPLAVDTPAHKLLPGQPLAPVEEQRAVGI